VADTSFSGGTRVRAGNAMGRTRVALLDAALVAVEKYGARHATMGDIATLANVAKGTLYNHFRSKDEVYAEAARAAVTSLGERAAVVAAADGLGAALSIAAEAVATSPVLARLRADEPGVLGALMNDAAGDTVRSAVAGVLLSGGVDGDVPAVEIVVRWIAGYVAGSADLATLSAVADRLALALLATRVPIVKPVDPPVSV
jgi:AcrR family transcriptional regulator